MWLVASACQCKIAATSQSKLREPMAAHSFCKPMHIFTPSWQRHSRTPTQLSTEEGRRMATVMLLSLLGLERQTSSSLKGMLCSLAIGKGEGQETARPKARCNKVSSVSPDIRPTRTGTELQLGVPVLSGRGLKSPSLLSAEQRMKTTTACPFCRVASSSLWRVPRGSP